MFNLYTWSDLIYSILYNKVLELDLLKTLVREGVLIKPIAIFELPYIKFTPNDIIITNKSFIEKNPAILQLEDIHLITVTSQPSDIFDAKGTIHYIQIPIDYVQLIQLLKDLERQ